jgi:DNA repair protein RecN (Recombination protein N)
VGDGAAADWVARALAALAGRRWFAELEDRLRSVEAEVAEAGADLRRATEAIVVDPVRLEEVRARRRLLADLRRKYGERLSDVLDYGLQAQARLAELEQHGERAEALEKERAGVAGDVAAAAAAVADARRAAAPRLAAAVEEQLRSLALPGARFEVAVGGPDPADEVTFLFAADAGSELRPLAKVASGGELSRTMLAVRLVLGADHGQADTLVFDEVDAGIGGQAALAVGRALAALAGDEAGAEVEAAAGRGRGRQVLVVTHLPQVAAFADHQVAVAKHERAGRTVAEARTLSTEERVVELSRMLSGQPASATARHHAEELLAVASRQRLGAEA